MDPMGRSKPRFFLCITILIILYAMEIAHLPSLFSRSSANPKKVDMIEGMHVIRLSLQSITHQLFSYIILQCTLEHYVTPNYFVYSVACGFAHAMVVVDRTDMCDRLDQVGACCPL